MEKLTKLAEPTILNPWGIYGGMFASALLVFIIIISYLAGMDKFDVGLISIIAMMNGYLHSLTIGRSNREAMFSYKSVCIGQEMAKVIKEQGLVIKKQKLLIKALEEADK